MIITIVSYLLVAVFCLATGTFLGFVLGRSFRSDLATGHGTEPQSMAREVLRRVQGVTERIAHDVNTHRSAVRQVDDRLHTVNVERDGIDTVAELVSQLVDRNDVIQRKLADAESKLDQLAEQISAQHVEARTDPVSGCANRIAFDEELSARHEAYVEHGESFCLVLIEIDDLATWSKQFGVHMEDDALRHVGRTLRRMVRASDFVARFSPNEFAILMPQMTMVQAKHAADAVRQAIAAHPIHHADGHVSLTASVGVVDTMLYEESHQLVQRAGTTLYAAKKAGGNRVCWHDGTTIHSIRDTSVESDSELVEAPAPGVTCDTIPLDDGESAVVRMATYSSSDESVPFDAELVQNLPSKTSFCQEVRHRLTEAEQGGPVVSVFVARLDNFDQLAEQYGVPTAQLALTTLANLIRTSVRDIDMLARYEPNSLGLLMPGATHEHVRGVCERLRQAADQTSITVHGTSIRLDTSLAGTQAQESEEMAELLKRIEQEMRASSGNPA